MKIKDMSIEELESLSYTDLAEMILVENKKTMNTADIFKKICNLLELGEDTFSNKIGDFYISLTTDKRFILLDKGLWDLKDKHKVEINLEEDDEDLESVEEEDEEENNEEEIEEFDSIDVTDDEVDLDDDSDMDELTIVDDEDLEDIGE